MASDTWHENTGRILTPNERNRLIVALLKANHEDGSGLKSCKEFVEEQVLTCID